jgi:RES domain-containing protein
MAVDAAAVAAAAPTTFYGEAFRHIAAGYLDPLSGEGARIHGGRFNPPESYPALYLCTTRACALAELRRLAGRQVIGLAGLLPRTLYRYEIFVQQVLDLTSTEVLSALGVTEAQVIGPDWTLPQQIGAAAHDSGWQAIIARSATGVDSVLTAFPENLGSGLITSHPVETWEEPADLDR